MAAYKNVNDMVEGLFGEDSKALVADMSRIGTPTNRKKSRHGNIGRRPLAEEHA